MDAASSADEDVGLLCANDECDEDAAADTLACSGGASSCRRTLLTPAPAAAFFLLLLLSCARGMWSSSLLVFCGDCSSATRGEKSGEPPTLDAVTLGLGCCNDECDDEPPDTGRVGGDVKLLLLLLLLLNEIRLFSGEHSDT